MKYKILIFTVILYITIPFTQIYAVSDDTWQSVFNRLDRLEQEVKELKARDCSNVVVNPNEKKIEDLEYRLVNLESAFDKLNKQILETLKTIITFLIKK